MSETKTKWALVTGASGGIGRETAARLAADGLSLVLVARSEGKLRALADELSEAHGVRCVVIAADLSDPGAPAEIAEGLRERGITAHTLVNNAGFGLYGAFVETELSAELSMIQVNIVALTELTKRLLPDMVAAGEGRILNVASTAAFQPGPLMAVYYATKAYVLSFSEALANELSGTGVTVTALCPGPTESGFQSQAQMEDSKLVQGKKLPTAGEVAEAGLSAMRRGKPVYIHGAQNCLLAWSVRFLPRKTVTGMVRSAQERTHA